VLSPVAGRQIPHRFWDAFSQTKKTLTGGIPSLYIPGTERIDGFSHTPFSKNLQQQKGGKRQTWVKMQGFNQAVDVTRTRRSGPTEEGHSSIVVYDL